MIGIFDSGLGGLTVVKEILRQLPGHDLVYFGDTARTPYGGKAPETVRRYAAEDARLLLEHGAEIIVVACNTASALAAKELRTLLPVPVFDVIGPAVARAAAVGKRRVGVIGTRGTVQSGIYKKMLRTTAPSLEVRGQACPLFVPLVEEGWRHGPVVDAIAKSYLRGLNLRGIDSLILGCTHYPFLRSVIARTVGPKVRLIDPARETVAALAARLKNEPGLVTKGRGRVRFLVSDPAGPFAKLAARWLGRKIKLERAIAG